GGGGGGGRPAGRTPDARGAKEFSRLEKLPYSAGPARRRFAKTQVLAYKLLEVEVPFVPGTFSGQDVGKGHPVGAGERAQDGGEGGACGIQRHGASLVPTTVCRRREQGRPVY